MSQLVNVKVNCPECGAENDFRMWKSINTEREHAIPDIISGRLFEMTCCRCGKTTRVDYPMLFNDMRDNMWIWYVMDDHLTPEFEKELRESRHMIHGRTRVVFSQPVLREKTDIISHGLDDRVVELMKVCVDQHFSSTYNDEIIMQCFCHVEEDNFRFELVTEKNSYSVSIERNVYDELADAFREELQEYGDDDFVVDENWVDDFLDFCDREELDE